MASTLKVCAAEQELRLLRPGRNAWRVERADRAAVLVDGGAYFGALRQAMRNASHSIYIVGWDINSQTRLVDENGETGDSLPETLGDFLSALVKKKPRLTIKLLLWDYSVVYSLSRELSPSLALQWKTPPQIELCMDDGLPTGSSHHQKIVVIDDCVAFSGGLDLTIRRWDSADHSAVNPKRADPAGVVYPPFHDVQMLVDGPAARALAELVHSRWAEAACDRARPAQASGDPWPARVKPEFRKVDVAISRTLPPSFDRPLIREVETLYLDMIAAAERHVYIENQFLTGVTVAEALAAALTAKPDLQALIIVPKAHNSWIGERAMLAGRIRFMDVVRAAAPDRVRLVYPQVVEQETAADVMVHAKVMIVDDRLLRVASSNLCNRSMGADTECDLTIEAGTAEERRAIGDIRDRLLAHHCGASAEEVAAHLRRTGSLLAVVDAIGEREHRLVTIVDAPSTVEEIVSGAVEMLADPERPLALLGVNGLSRRQALRRRLRSIARFGVAIAAIIVIALLWRYTELSRLTEPGRLGALLTDMAANPLAPIAVILIFVAGGLVGFPVTLLIVATAISFGAWPGLFYAAAGALASASVTYFIGSWLGAQTLRRFLGPRLIRVRRVIARRGILTVMAVRLVPIAPFTLVNLAAGAFRIPLTDYLIGTLLGLLPGLAVMSLLGDQLVRMLNAPTPLEVEILVVLLILWIGLSLGLQTLLARLRERRA